MTPCVVIPALNFVYLAKGADVNKETAAALEASIKHWEDNAVASFSKISLSSSSCALCHKFRFAQYSDDDDAQENDCIGCPIFEKTGEPYCDNSPYMQAAVAKSLWNQARYAVMSEIATRERFRAAARTMVDFLKSLREPKS